MYQSACKVPGVTGVVEIVKEAYPDDEQFDPKSKYYDSKATKDNPKWSMVDIKFVRYSSLLTWMALGMQAELVCLGPCSIPGCCVA